MGEKKSLVIYDIVDDKNRNKIVEILESFGIRVQKSAFEVIISDDKLYEMVQALEKWVDIDRDSLRIYTFSEYVSIKNMGILPPTEKSDFIF